MVTESVVKIYDITVNQFVLFLMFVACAANKYPYCVMPWFSLSGALAIWQIFEIAMTIVKIYTLPNQIPGYAPAGNKGVLAKVILAYRECITMSSGT